MELSGPIALIFLTAVFAELIWAWRGEKKVYDAGEAFSNLGVLLGNALLRPAAFAWAYFLYSLIEPLQIATFPQGPVMFAVSFLAADLVYYGYHRLSHEIPLLWTIHHTHHSGSHMNLTTAVRLNWLGKFIGPLALVPLILVGFNPEFVAGSFAIGLLYQFFLHTEMIPRLGRFEGWILNTPSAHRVHHGSNEAYIDKNYGAVLIVWDRLFGTYAPEAEAVNYGVTTGPVGHNPFKIVLAPLVSYLRGTWRREKDVLRDRREGQGRPRAEVESHSGAPLQRPGTRT
ncbi:MAG: sterol desaturase family protein [Acidobacteriota bacterium]